MVFATHAGIFLFPLSLSRAGHWLNLGPHEALSLAASESELGDAVLRCLDQSKNGVPNQRDFKSLTAAMARKCGFRSWRKLGESSRLVTLRTSEDRIRLEHWAWDGKGAHSPAASHRSLEIPLDPELVGNTLREAFHIAASAV